MKTTHYKRSTCRLCNHSELDLVLPLKPSAIADAFVPQNKLADPQPVFPLDLYLCRSCGHAQLLDVLEPEILFSNYIYETSSSNSLKEHFRQYADAVLALQPPSPDSLAIDIGSNDGTLLRFFKDKGFTVLGIDPAQSIAAKATASGIETLPRFFDSKVAHALRVERGPASIMTANNVFAHSDAIGDMTDGIRELLAPDGLFIFEVSYLLDMVQNMVFDWIYHEHLCYHSIRPMRDFFHRHGLELIDVQRVTTKGGSIRCMVQRAGGAKPVQSIVGEMIAIEKEVGLQTNAFFDRYYQRIKVEKQKLLALLQNAKARGETIAGYGASATTTTLIYHFELGPYLSFLFDDDKLRHHLYSPGHHIPVLPSEDIYEKHPDCIVILAWRYSNPIILRHASYLKEGGRFIVPLPVLREVDALTQSK